MADKKELEKAEKVETPAKPKAAEFSKTDILKSKKYQDKRDILSAVLDEKKTYSHEELGKILLKFSKEGVR